jgi:hypothetical protein
MMFRPGTQVLRLCLGIVVTAITVVICVPVPDHTRHTVDEYLHNAELRRLELDRCARLEGPVSKSSDCKNARAAARMDGGGSLRDLPSLRLEIR